MVLGGLGPGKVGGGLGLAPGCEYGSGIGDSVVDALGSDGGGNRDVESEAQDGDGDADGFPDAGNCDGGEENEGERRVVFQVRQRQLFTVLGPGPERRSGLSATAMNWGTVTLTWFPTLAIAAPTAAGRTRVRWVWLPW